jgi:HTH-type transcriptional regulator / antitoxin HipB
LILAGKWASITVREYFFSGIYMNDRFRNYNSAEIGEIVKYTRKKLGVTQRQLALTSGTGLRFIIELEQGKPTCQLEKVLTILRTLGIKLKIEGNKNVQIA